MNPNYKVSEHIRPALNEIQERIWISIRQNYPEKENLVILRRALFEKKISKQEKRSTPKANSNKRNKDASSSDSSPKKIKTFTLKISKKNDSAEVAKKKCYRVE